MYRQILRRDGKEMWVMRNAWLGKGMLNEEKGVSGEVYRIGNVRHEG